MYQANTQIFVDQLPTIDDIKYENIERAHRKVSLISVGIIMSFILVAIILLTIFADDDRLTLLSYILATGWIVITTLWIYLCYQDYHTTGYAIREKDVVYKSGIFFKSITIVPYNRVQHCEISQGPVSRYFGLSSLTIYTAGGSSTEVDIDGLSTETAYKLKQYLMTKISVDEEE
jgi:uncharacterized protein